MLQGKKILVGVTGSIAAYKSAFLVRLLVKEGCEVKVVMTGPAKDFVAPLTFSVLSKNKVASEFASHETGEWTNHVDLGLWADAMIIAPATANTLSNMASGACNNLLLAVYLSARCQVFIAPAMDLDMWKHPSTVSNIEKLKSFGNKIIAPSTGELASGLTGEGRMEEPENIMSVLSGFFLQNLPLKDKKVLVTAGPTYESIDPVRFIGNRSTGKMGFAIADELAKQGADVVLVSGPSSQTLAAKAIQRIDVESAKEMYDACMRHSENMDVIIMSAAVADYKPESPSGEKIKKQDSKLTVPLVHTVDILAELGKRKKAGQLIVGFALETSNEMENASAKLKKKNLDFIVLNSLRDEGAGFGHDTNRVKMISNRMDTMEFDLKSKSEVAKDIIHVIVEHLKSSKERD